MDEMRWWAQSAASGIRFRPDREAAEQELIEHMEDKQELLMRARGLKEQEAGLEAVRQMGDAGRVRQELAKIHSPWMGWLWQASRVVLVVLLAVSLFSWGPQMARDLQNRWEVWNIAKQNDPLEPYAGGNEHFGDLIQFWTRGAGESVQSGGYLFRVERTALWGGRQEDGQEFRILYCQLKADGLPWQPFSTEAARHIRATDSTGKTYLSTYERFTLDGVRRETIDVVITNLDVCDGPFSQSFEVEMYVPVDAQWLRLEFDRGGPAWSLTIPLTEDAA